MRSDPKITGLLVKRLQACQQLDGDMLLCAHVTAALLAPPGSFVSIGPVTGDIRVCVEKDKITQKDVIWGDWPAWRLRWMAGTIDSALGVVERTIPGLDYMLSRRMLPATLPPFTCVLTVPTGEIIGQARHCDNAAAVLLALLDSISPKKRDERFAQEPAQGNA